MYSKSQKIEKKSGLYIQYLEFYGAYFNVESVHLEKLRKLNKSRI